MHLYHIPNLVLGIKLRNQPTEFIICHLSFRYWNNENVNGSVSIGNESLMEYIKTVFNGIILVEKEDNNFSLYENLSNSLSLKCMSYSYSELDEVDDPSIDSVISKLESILENNITEIIKDQDISISGVSLTY